MKVVGLVSGGKDSCYNLMKCVSYGHEIVAIANLAPKDTQQDESDSHMFQTIGHGVVRGLAECIGVPFYTTGLGGGSLLTELNYQATSGDEVEDMYALLKRVKEEIPEVEAVSSGAILSSYQRLRVENVCSRLGLTSLAFLWEKEQRSLLSEMLSNGLHAILLKVASMGLDPRKHLGRSLGELQPHLLKIGDLYGVNECGEGGEYETLTLDCPLFRKRLVLDDTELVGDLHTDIAPVAVLRINKWHLEEKVGHDPIKACREMVHTAISTSRVEEEEEEEGNNTTAAESSTDSTSALSIPSSPAFAPFPSSDALPSFPTANVIGDHCFVSSSPVSSDGSLSDAADIAAALTRRIERMQSSLQEYQFQLSDVMYMQMFLEQMEHFAAANAQYVKLLPMTSAASRACLQLSAHTEGTPAPLLVDCVASRARRDVLHVQSVSEWAPSCIGPYSQASKCNQSLWLAGQIGLDPATMTLASDPLQQARLAFRHCTQILHAQKSNWAQTVSAVVYWKKEFWEGQQAMIQKQLLPLCHKQLSPASAKAATKNVMHVVVPALPRDALLEVQLIAQPHTPALELAAFAPANSQQGSFSCQTHHLHASKLFGSSWTTLSVETAALQQGQQQDVNQAVEIFVQSMEEALAAAKLRWSHVLIFRLYYTSLVTERELRIALARALQAKGISPLPAVSFLPVAHLQQQVVGRSPSASSSSPSSSTLPFLSAHLFLLTRQLASRDYNPMRIDSDEEDDE